MRASVAIVCTIACWFLIGCGAVGDPHYPALNLATRVTDLAAVERGDRIAIVFTISPVTTEGMVLKTIGSIDLRVGPNPDASRFNADRWAATATRADIPAPAAPGQVTASVPLGDWVGKEVVIGVRIGNAKGRMSDWSNFVTRTIQAALATPTDLEASAAPEGVRLQWKAPGETKFRVYRRAEGEQSPSELAMSDREEYIDASIDWGKTYEYFVQGVKGDAESDAVALTKPITPIDTFPPAPPANVSATTGVNSIDVSWERNTEKDFKEYRVYRSAGEAPFEKIAEGLEGPSYSDAKLESGKRYRYRVTAVDQTGNESAPSTVVEATAP
jgi:fibronectin type 3 domain-containing protein